MKLERCPVCRGARSLPASRWFFFTREVECFECEGEGEYPSVTEEPASLSLEPFQGDEKEIPTITLGVPAETVKPETHHLAIMHTWVMMWRCQLDSWLRQPSIDGPATEHIAT